MLRWGLVPSWADDLAIGNRTINARSESVAEKPAFRSAFKKRRCLVLADGFYEWQKTGKTKPADALNHRLVSRVYRSLRRAISMDQIRPVWQFPDGMPPTA